MSFPEEILDTLSSTPEPQFTPGQRLYFSHRFATKNSALHNRPCMVVGTYQLLDHFWSYRVTFQDGHRILPGIAYEDELHEEPQ